MGYYVVGNLTVTIREEHELAVALAIPSIPSLASMFSSTKGSLILELLTYAGFENYEEGRKSDEGTVYNLSFDTKWRDTPDIVLNLLARHGVPLSGEFRGEDDSRWECRVVNNRLVDVPLDSIAADALDNLEAQSKALTALVTALIPLAEQNPDVANLLAQVAQGQPGLQRLLVAEQAS
jgi:hypothetical protein